MLRIPAPFPEPGSYALYEGGACPGPRSGGPQQLARIQQRLDDGRHVIVSFPERPEASGRTTLPLADLVDATPLSAAEEAEYRGIEAKITGKARPRRALVERLEALRLRSIRAPILERLLAEHERREKARTAYRPTYGRRAYG